MSVVQWFPGHMTKAIREIESRISEVDMIIECRDARVPFSSSNPVIDKIIGQKPRLIVLTKKDLANSEITQQWQDHFQEIGTPVVLVNVLKDNIARVISQGCLAAMKPKHDRDLKRGIKPRMIRAMIMGVPNVGKSTLMNRLVNKKVAETQNRPGVTRSLKKVRVSDKLEVVDSPGLLWPKFDDIRVGYHLALCLSVKETGFKMDDVVEYGLDYLLTQIPDKIQEAYDTVSQNPQEIISKVASDLGVNYHKASESILNDITKHRFGRVSYERLDTFRDTVLEQQ